MSGLRSRQKARRHQRILEAAAKLFRKAGYEAVKIEAIATAAEVSIGTIYNYYQNKGDLLVAIVSMEVNEVLNAGEQVIAHPPRNAEKAVDALIGNYIEHSLVYLSKAMWRQAMAISTQQPDSPCGVTYAALDKALARQTCRLVEKLKYLGLIAGWSNSRSIGELLFNNTNMNFIIFIKSEAVSVAQLRATIRRQHRTIINAVKVG
jgi:AcrR family transcriptional regulator